MVKKARAFSAVSCERGGVLKLLPWVHDKVDLCQCYLLSCPPVKGSPLQAGTTCCAHLTMSLLEKKQPIHKQQSIGEDSRQPSSVVPEAATAASQSLMERGEMKMEPKIEKRALSG